MEQNCLYLQKMPSAGTSFIFISANLNKTFVNIGEFNEKVNINFILLLNYKRSTNFKINKIKVLSNFFRLL